MHKLQWGDIADAMEMSESALRHWLNGTREPNLSDFVKLCQVVKADACQILFGSTREMATLQSIRQLVEETPPRPQNQRKGEPGHIERRAGRQR